jgi:hypothetical protein
MSEELRKQLQYRIDGAASILNVTASEVRKHRPVKDFLIDAMGKRWGAIEIASQALAYLYCRRWFLGRIRDEPRNERIGAATTHERLLLGRDNGTVYAGEVRAMGQDMVFLKQS